MRHLRNFNTRKLYENNGAEFTETVEAECERHRGKIESVLSGMSTEELADQAAAVGEFLAQARQSSQAQGISERRYSASRGYRRMNEGFFDVKEIGITMRNVGIAAGLISTASAIYNFCMAWTSNPALTNDPGMGGGPYQVAAGYSALCIIGSIFLSVIGQFMATGKAPFER